MKEQISKKQYFILVVMYITANDVFRAYFSKQLQNNIWIPNLIGLIISLLIFFSYIFIYKNNNYSSFVKCIENITGKFISKILFILYTIYFTAMCFFIARDIIELLKIYLIPLTPLFVIGLLLMITVIYMTNHGIEVMSRVSTLLFYAYVVLFVFFVGVLLSIKDLHFEFFLPILEEGVKPILLPSFYMSYTIPFGGLFVMLIIYQFVKDSKKGYKWGMLGLVFVGIVFLMVNALNIIIVGPNAIGFGYSTVVRLSKMIDIEKYIQRFDIVVTNTFVLFVLIKMGILIFASNHIIMESFKLKNSKIVPIILSLVIVGVILFAGEDYLKLIDLRVNYFWRYICLAFELIIPLLLIIFSFARKKKQNNQVTTNS